jgi:hypothetical protein
MHTSYDPIIARGLKHVSTRLTWADWVASAQISESSNGLDLPQHSNP